jgi:hypothetical protein
MNKTPEFKEISEIVSNPYFVDFLTKNLSDLKAQRKLRPLPPTGFNYKKDWMDKMDVSVDYFISNIEAIWLKKSKLNRSEREIIGYLCDKSFIQTLAKYKELESNQIGLSSEITYTKETPDSYDGEKPNMMFDDEEGMTASADVVKKWDIIKNNGLEITGMPMIEQDFTEVGNYVKNMITGESDVESTKLHITETAPDCYDGEKQHFIHDDEIGNTQDFPVTKRCNILKTKTQEEMKIINLCLLSFFANKYITCLIIPNDIQFSCGHNFTVIKSDSVKGIITIGGEYIYNGYDIPLENHLIQANAFHDSSKIVPFGAIKIPANFKLTREFDYFENEKNSTIK